MPACRQCGKDNPEGTVVCGYCAAPISSRASGEAGAPLPVHKIELAPLAASKPVKRAPAIRPARAGMAKGAIEWIAWNELTGRQKAGRAAAILFVLLLFGTLLRLAAGRIGSSFGPRTVASPEPSQSPLTATERADGLASICPTVGIYGVPQNDNEAVEVARHADDLFKLPGNRPPERSRYILTRLAREFQSGALKSSDCPSRSSPSANPTPAMFPTPR